MHKKLVCIIISMLLFATISSVAVSVNTNIRGSAITCDNGDEVCEAWNKTFGGYSSDYGYSGQQTNDGGYIIIGQTYSYDVGSGDVWLIKTDQDGNEEWSQTFGGSETDKGNSVQQTNDDGYIIAGYTKIGSTNWDVWLIKTDQDGNETWNQTFGGGGFDNGYSVQQTNDDGYIIAGYTRIGYNYDVWLIKTDQDGNETWNQTFGGSDNDSGYSVQQTNDSGYIITGYTESYGAGDYDVWLIKTDQDGNETWNQTFGGGNHDYGHSVQQTNDDGYIITGYTKSYGPGSSYDVWLIKIIINNAPEKPTLNGPDTGFPGEDITFEVNTTDPDGHQVRYGFDWDNDDVVDEWTDFYDSGATAEASHSWGTEGTYIIKVLAEDEYGAPSEWSDPLEVTITEPELEIGEITGGFGGLGNGGIVCAEIKNVGDGDASDVEWNISVKGGLFEMIDVMSEGTIATLEAHSNETVCTDIPIRGFGNVDITVTASEPNGSSDTKNVTGFVFFVFVIIT